jgi:hypothetical protein
LPPPPPPPENPPAGSNRTRASRAPTRLRLPPVTARCSSPGPSPRSPRSPSAAAASRSTAEGEGHRAHRRHGASRRQRGRDTQRREDLESFPQRRRLRRRKRETRNTEAAEVCGRGRSWPSPQTHRRLDVEEGKSTRVARFGLLMAFHMHGMSAPYEGGVIACTALRLFYIGTAELPEARSQGISSPGGGSGSLVPAP